MARSLARSRQRRVQVAFELLKRHRPDDRTMASPLPPPCVMRGCHQTLIILRPPPSGFTCRVQEARCSAYQLCYRCTIARMCHLFVYNDLSALRASLQTLSSLHRVMLHVCSIQRATSSLTMDNTHLVIDEAHTTGVDSRTAPTVIYRPGGHSILSMRLGLFLTDIDGRD